MYQFYKPDHSPGKPRERSVHQYHWKTEKQIEIIFLSNVRESKYYGDLTALQNLQKAKFF